MTVAASLGAIAQQWTPIGPDGGDVRSLAYDPRNPDHILLGTSTGQLFASNDGGRSWARFAHLGDGDDYVLDHIVFDSHDGSIYVAAWSLENTNAGDIFRSRDRGRTWEMLPGMHGKSIRSFTMAPSNNKILLAGALDGVYRSMDAGRNWERISPPDHSDIKNIESLAIDNDPNVIYAGTWHLAWRTTDGGRNWEPMKNGVIDDSDVFSIIIDHSNPQVLYLSACSGMYKSENAGVLYHKIQGVPNSARRTRVLKQDPQNPNVVYAGTTEGLYRSNDAGKTFTRVSDPNVIVNDIMIDPRNTQKVVLATDRSGVLISEQGGSNLQASNKGFSHRQVSTIIPDRNEPSTLYVGVVNDKEFGGVFVSKDGGLNWRQMSNGLGKRDVFILRQSLSGDLIAGTNQGMFILRKGMQMWQPINTILNERRTAPKVRIVKGRKVRSSAPVEVSRGTISGRVNDIQITPRKWYAATAQGVFTSVNSGRTWQGGTIASARMFMSVAAGQQISVAATSNAVYASVDGGSSWYASKMPAYVTLVYGVSVAPDNSLWMATRSGAYRSTNGGETWDHVFNGLPALNVQSVRFDEQAQRMLATVYGSSQIFESSDNGNSWKAINSGWKVRGLQPVAGRFYATTTFDGVVAQPESGRGSSVAEQ
jgi:photosystem II stability/assembly factor-like uncharacterized protein